MELPENHSLENISLFFSVLLSFSTLIITMRIGKSSFQLWQVIIITAFILISSKKKIHLAHKHF